MKNSMIATLALLVSLLLSGCVAAPPSQTHNVCGIFKEKPKWYWATQKTEKRWGVPVPVQMAIVQQESHFQAKSRPQRRWILGIIPWFRPSSAYGYAQILDGTWQEYQHKTSAGGARDDFATISEFIGWYAEQANQQVNVPKQDAYQLYLAYHEGAGGYHRQSYLKKPWLVKVAAKVKHRADQFAQQLQACQASLPRKHWWHFWG